MIYAINLLLLGRAFLFGCAGFWSSGFRGRLGRWGFLGSGRATRVDQVKSVFSVEWELTNRRLSCGAESYVNAAVMFWSWSMACLTCSGLMDCSSPRPWVSMASAETPLATR